MDQKLITKLFSEFLAQYDVEKYQQIWREHSKTFREFWNLKIMNKKSGKLSGADYDPIIRLLDIKGRGFRKETDEAVARVGLTMGTWYRIFNDLKAQESIRTTLNKIFVSDEDRVLIDLINRLEKENEKNKNGLTGKNASALSALLFSNNPERFISSVSLPQRFQIIKTFGLSQPEAYKSYGEKIIRSNRDIINSFRVKFSIDSEPRTISRFFYLPEVKSLWRKKDKDEEDDQGVGDDEVSNIQSDFVIEKHLEDFLIGNWESTALGKLYDLIEEGEELVSQQYRTDIGNIDLLVMDKKDGSYVVIELKKGQTSDDTVGQLARYTAWIKKHKAKGAGVRGIIIAGAYDQKLKYALESCPNMELLIYRINFSLEKPKN